MDRQKKRGCRTDFVANTNGSDQEQGKLLPAASKGANQIGKRLPRSSDSTVISATALAASVTDPGVFRSGREFSASLGLVPRQNSSGGKDRLGRISKMGDRYLRKLLVVGATSVVRRARTADTNAANWVRSLLERKPARLVTVAMANKTARIVWAVLARGETYRSPAAI